MSYYGDPDVTLIPWQFSGEDHFFPHFTRVPHAQDILNHQRLKRKNSRQSAECMLRGASFLLLLCLMAVGVSAVFLILDKAQTQTGSFSKINNPSLYTWSDWTAWSTCSVTCGSGTRTRARLCNQTIEVSAATANDMVDSCEELGLHDNELDECLEQSCPTDGNGEGGGDTNNSTDTTRPPEVNGFKGYPLNKNGTTFIYTCEHDTHSIEVGSANVTCPVIQIDSNDQTWAPFHATCVKVREEAKTFSQYGGSTFAESGYITSPLHPLSYPNETAVHLWTLASAGSTLQFQLLTLYTDSQNSTCDRRSTVSIYCGCDIPLDNPSYGPYCGQMEDQPFLLCNTTCAIVRFESLPRSDKDATGFHFQWRSF